MLFSARIRQTIASSFLVLFALILLNGIVYRHAHKLQDGRIVSHAHPFKPIKSNSPFQPNDHTANELFWLDEVTNAAFATLVVATILAWVALMFSLLKPSVLLYENAYCAPQFLYFSRRGPPQAHDVH